MVQGKPVALKVTSSVGKSSLAAGRTFAVVAFTVLGLLGGARSAQAREPRPTAQADVGVVSRAELPPEAQRVEQLIRRGGPFAYEKDGGVFGNRERLLPRQPRGYYHEYTVRTPGARDRGARRIICGGRQLTEPAACFYTEDHYASFRRIVQ